MVSFNRNLVIGKSITTFKSLNLNNCGHLGICDGLQLVSRGIFIHAWFSRSSNSKYCRTSHLTGGDIWNYNLIVSAEKWFALFKNQETKEISKMLIDKNVAPEGRQKWIDGNRKEHKQKRVYNKTHSVNLYKSMFRETYDCSMVLSVLIIINFDFLQQNLGSKNVHNSIWKFDFK